MRVIAVDIQELQLLLLWNENLSAVKGQLFKNGETFQLDENCFYSLPDITPHEVTVR